MIPTYKILSLLLDYPTGMLQESLADIGCRLREEKYLDEADISSIEAFINYAVSLPLLQWEEQYVALFDQATGANLYLFDHIYGSSRDRGQAMVDLKEMYLGSGFAPCNDELPDYLPLFLEFAAMQPNVKKAELLLAEIKSVVAGMKKRMEKQQTPYIHLIHVVCNLAGKADLLTNTVPKTEKGALS